MPNRINEPVNKQSTQQPLIDTPYTNPAWTLHVAAMTHVAMPHGIVPAECRAYDPLLQTFHSHYFDWKPLKEFYEADSDARWNAIEALALTMAAAPQEENTVGLTYNDLIDGLTYIAYADGVYTPEEHQAIGEIRYCLFDDSKASSGM